MQEENPTTFNVTQSLISSITSIPCSPDTANTTFFLHATNCLGVWGTGIAKALKEQFPNAFEADRQSCRQDCPPGEHPTGDEVENIIGTCHIIPPNVVSDEAPFSIVCLRTSRGYGRPTVGKAGLDKKDVVLEQTRWALQDFRAQLEDLGDERQRDIVVWSPQINSGGFHIPWERTKEIIEEVFQGWEGKWLVMNP
ncbi:ADP-ribose 1''-phosphate phosphatase [Cytospora mali]|uniref:ADP-ribose 1''-phosphate phosphatase n=1 Tax=Cytospora mali TaxID=578113 RepID=A0A194VT91_CYTMA|nr:ADP-ribose 1''-phosphate phosphatase [Valsa mali]